MVVKLSKNWLEDFEFDGAISIKIFIWHASVLVKYYIWISTAQLDWLTYHHNIYQLLDNLKSVSLKQKSRKICVKCGPRSEYFQYVSAFPPRATLPPCRGLWDTLHTGGQY